MTDVRSHLDRSAMLLMIGLCAIWGVQQVVIKVAVLGISPVWQAALRSIGATLLVWLWARGRGVPLWKPDGSLRAGLLAGLLFAGEFALLYWGLQYTSASRGVIFLYTAPFMVALGALWLLPGESLRRAQWGGMALAFAGVLLLFGENLFKGSAQAWLGDAMILLAALLWAATTLTVKASTLARIAPEKTLLYQLAVSAVLLPPVAMALGEPGIFAPTPVVLAAMAFQVLVVATVSYLGWFWLIRHYPATRLSSFSFLTPLMGVLAGVAFLGEPFTPALVGALLLVGGGIWIANRPPRG